MKLILMAARLVLLHDFQDRMKIMEFLSSQIRKFKSKN
jgi:hypothetical protein